MVGSCSVSGFSLSFNDTDNWNTNTNVSSHLCRMFGSTQPFKSKNDYTMPLDYKQYHPKWSLISRLIRFFRAKNKCEWCDAPNYQLIYRPIKCSNEWRLWPEGMESEALTLDGYKSVKVILTVEHIDHDKNNNRFKNLAALCQRCHLKHDIKHHCANRKYGRNHKGDHQLKLKI